MEQKPNKEQVVPSASSSEACTDPYLRCAFNGAALTALGISNSSLLAHSPQGCEYLVDNAFASQECDYMETMTLCTIIGDDIMGVCKSLQPEVKFRLVPIECAGFRGSV